MGGAPSDSRLCTRSRLGTRKLLSLAAAVLTATLIVFGATGCSHPCDGDGGVKTYWHTPGGHRADFTYICNDGTTQQT